MAEADRYSRWAWLESGQRPGDTNPALLQLAGVLREINDRLVTGDAPEAALAELTDGAERLRDRLFAATEAQSRADAATEPREQPEFFDASPVTGRANVVAPPLRLWLSGNEVHGAATFSAAYEGPPGCVHGGIIAAAFDELLGSAQSLSAQSGMTGTLTVRYRRPTPLHREVHFRARIERTEGRKLFIAGTLHVDGALCADAEGVFIAVDFEAMQRAAIERKSNRMR